MSRYDEYTREELIRRIEELESTPASVPEKQPDGKLGRGRFREKYASEILDSIPDMLSIFSPEGRFVDLVSAEATNHTGISSEELYGKHLSIVLTPENTRNLMQNLQKAFRTGAGSMAHHDITLDGVTRHYENRIFPLDSAHALCMCRDVTEEQRTKCELEMVKYAINNVDEEIYACDMDGEMIYANQQFRTRNQLTGSLEGRKVYEFWLPAGNERLWKERLQRIRADKEAHKYTVRFKDDRGRIVAWDLVAYIISDDRSDREIVWFFGRDVTTRIHNENKVKEVNSVMDSILNNIPVYLFVKDPGNEFRYLYWNRAFEQYSGIPASKALGHTDYEIFPSLQDAEKFRRDDLELLRTGERISFQEEYVNQAGETRIVTTSKALVSMENRLPLIIGVSWDITEQKEAETQIIRARIKAEESDKLKSAFLANMSHEIRTPLNAIVGFSKLVGEAETDEEKHQYAEIIDSNAELLLQLINDILDLSKIEAGTLEFREKTMDLNELCRAEYEVFRARMPEGVELVFDEKYDKAEIRCDQNRLSQVLTNLLTNAIKFTRRGRIRFGYEIGGDRIDFYVCDTGVGIAPEKLDRIFDRFVKLNDFAVGTGLGLSITKMIVEKMGGTIGVESEVGKGTCFRFSIPYRRKRKAEKSEPVAVKKAVPAPQMTPAGKHGVWKVLVAEDIESNYLLIQALVGQRFELVRACNGQEAVEKFRAERPDVVLMDMKMPLMDGYEATRLIRAEAPDVPIVAMTAFASEQDREKAFDSGCSDYLTKPLSMTELNRKLNACLIENVGE